MAYQSSHAITDAWIVVEVVADDMGVAEFGDKQQTASTGAESGSGGGNSGVIIAVVVVVAVLAAGAFFFLM